MQTYEIYILCFFKSRQNFENNELRLTNVLLNINHSFFKIEPNDRLNYQLTTIERRR
jgi:hypothetical protein